MLQSRGQNQQWLSEVGKLIFLVNFLLSKLFYVFFLLSKLHSKKIFFH